MALNILSNQQLLDELVRQVGRNEATLTWDTPLGIDLSTYLSSAQIEDLEQMYLAGQLSTNAELIETAAKYEAAVSVITALQAEYTDVVEEDDINNP